MKHQNRRYGVLITSAPQDVVVSTIKIQDTMCVIYIVLYICSLFMLYIYNIVFLNLIYLAPRYSGNGRIEPQDVVTRQMLSELGKIESALFGKLGFRNGDTAF